MLTSYKNGISIKEILPFKNEAFKYKKCNHLLVEVYRNLNGLSPPILPHGTIQASTKVLEC